MQPHQRYRREKRKCLLKGFAAVELMIAVAVLGLLMTIAVPSLKLITEQWRVREATDHLQSTLHFARSEAIKRGGHVVLEKISTNTSCTAKNAREWDCGWTVCDDLDGDGACGKSDLILQRNFGINSVHVSRTGGGTAIKFNRWGLVDGNWPGFTLIPFNGSVSHPGSRGVCMSSGGRVRVISQEAIPCNSN